MTKLESFIKDVQAIGPAVDLGKYSKEMLDQNLTMWLDENPRDYVYKMVPSVRNLYSDRMWVVKVTPSYAVPIYGHDPMTWGFLLKEVIYDPRHELRPLLIASIAFMSYRRKEVSLSISLGEISNLMHKLRKASVKRSTS